MEFRDLPIKDTWNPFKGLANPELDNSTIPESEKQTYIKFHKKLHEHNFPKLIPQPRFVVASKECSSIIRVNYDTLKLGSNISYLSGEKIHTDAYPYSSRYAGHQYGEFSILGDGRTFSLGKYEKYIVQLRGAGESRLGEKKNGLIPLTSCLHEFLMSETLMKLRIPTTYNLAVVGSPLPCDNDPAGIITRFAPTWVRFGTLEYFFYRGELDLLKSLVDSIINDYYPGAILLEGKETLVSTHLIPRELYNDKQESIDGGNMATGDNIDSLIDKIGQPVTVQLNRYAIFFRQVMHKVATLVAQWQANGFVHGLLNTENLSIIGLGMNYEKSGFMDSYDPEWTPNIDDVDKRYSFEKQPEMAKWALARLGQTICHLVGESWIETSARPVTRGLGTPRHEIMEMRPITPALPPTRKFPMGMGFLFNSAKAENIIRELLDEFEGVFTKKYGEFMCEKLGVKKFEETDYDTLINPLLDIMASTGVDYTAFFRAITNFSCTEAKYNASIQYNPKGAHSEENLRNNEQTDCLGLLLKALLDLRDEDSRYIQNEVAKLKESGINPVKMDKLEPIIEEPQKEGEQKDGPRYDIDVFPQLRPLPFPTMDDVVVAWKHWTVNYRTRLISQSANGKDSKDADLSKDDVVRQTKLAEINPKYCLRNSILQEIYSETKSNFPLLQPLKKTTKKDSDQANGSIENEIKFPKLEKLQKLLIDDLYGKIAELRQGFDNEDENILAARWAKVPSLANSNININISTE